MIRMMKLSAALAACALLAVPAAAANEAAMLATANGFYAVYATFHPSDGIPDDAARAKYAPFLTPALEQLLLQAHQAEAAFAKANKNSPPLMEGDLFSSLFEGATAYAVRSCDVKSASCAVDLTYDDKTGKPVRWSDTLNLVMTPQGWRINDITYGGNWDFANKGRLTETLHFVISNADE